MKLTKITASNINTTPEIAQSGVPFYFDGDLIPEIPDKTDRIVVSWNNNEIPVYIRRWRRYTLSFNAKSSELLDLQDSISFGDVYFRAKNTNKDILAKDITLVCESIAKFNKEYDCTISFTDANSEVSEFRFDFERFAGGVYSLVSGLATYGKTSLAPILVANNVTGDTIDTTDTIVFAHVQKPYYRYRTYLSTEDKNNFVYFCTKIGSLENEYTATLSGGGYNQTIVHAEISTEELIAPDIYEVECKLYTSAAIIPHS